MRRTIAVWVSLVAGVLLAGGTALALPSETPDETLMLNGPVRAFAQIGDLLWVGGNFTRVQERDGTPVAEVSNVAVFDLTTDEYVDIAPDLGPGSQSSKVRGMDVYGGDVILGGRFEGPGGKKNLVLVDGTTGDVVRWYNAAALQSVAAAPTLDRIYGGGVSLAAFEASGPQKLWTRAKTVVDKTLRTHDLSPGYRDLQLDGGIIWAACACDEIGGEPVKALVKLDTEGALDTGWDTQAGTDAFGISVTHEGGADGTVFLGAGGSDFLAAYAKGNGGTHNAPGWKRDTSGSTQVVEVMDGQLVVGGHFWEVADQASDQCGFRSSDNDTTLDPGDVCETRKGLAIYSFGGDLQPDWDAVLDGKYNLAWALHPEVTPAGTRLHVGGEFTKAGGFNQDHYARFFEASPPAACTITGSPGADVLTGTPGDDVICAGTGRDTVDGLGGDDIIRGEGGKDTITGGPGDDAIDGGPGPDTVDLSGAPSAVIASLTAGTATGEGADTITGVENVTGSDSDDTLVGSDADNVLKGGRGDDSIFGLGGADKLRGVAGEDTLDSKDDVNGNDVVDGGGRTDTCITDATEKSIQRCEL